MSEKNPYHPLSPPDDPTLFFGRQDAVAFLRQHLVGADNRQFIMLLGRAGFGKTALLHHTAYIVDERYQTVYVDTAEIAPLDEVNFLRQLTITIVARMEALGVDTYRVPPFPLAVTDVYALRQWFANEFLDVAVTAIRRDRFLLLLFDDWQLIFEALDKGLFSSDFMAFMGGLLEQYDRLDFVAALDIAEEQRALNYPPTANIQQHFRLQPLDDEAAHQLLVDPLEGAFEYLPETLARLQALCDGYPFLIHSVCRLLYRHYQNNPQLTHIAPEFLEVIYPAALEETNEIMTSFWDNSTPNMQMVIRALLAFSDQGKASTTELNQWMTHQGTALNPTQVVAALRRLEYWSLVKTTPEGDFAFSTQLEAAWLQEKFEEQARITVRRTPFKPSAWAGVAIIIGALLLVLLLFLLGVFEGGDTTNNPENAPPTATFALNLQETATAISPTPSRTPRR